MLTSGICGIFLGPRLRVSLNYRDYTSIAMPAQPTVYSQPAPTEEKPYSIDTAVSSLGVMSA